MNMVEEIKSWNDEIMGLLADCGLASVDRRINIRNAIKDRINSSNSKIFSFSISRIVRRRAKKGKFIPKGLEYLIN